MAREGQNYTGDTYTVFGQTYTLDLTDYEIIFASLTTLLVILAVARSVFLPFFILFYAIQRIMNF